MPAVAEITAEQLATVRSGGMASECRIALCPNTIVFSAEITQTITDSVFAQFTWDNALQGAYTDCIAGQTVFITATDDPAELRRPLFRGRVRTEPSATDFFINESSLALLSGYIVTVIDTYEVWQRDRNGLLYIDWDVTFTPLLPIVKDMQTFYYGENATEFQFTFTPTGQAMEEGETTDAYHWDIPGATYDSGDEDSQNITVTVPYGHIWAHLTITDTGGNANIFHFEILVCPRDDTAFLFEAHDSIQINAELASGLNASTTYFAGIEAVLNRTRCAVIAFDVYKAGSGVFNNIMFVGYLVNEDTGVAGDPISSTLAQTSFEIQSFTALAGQQFCPLLAIRNAAVPSAWDQINLPTPQRILSYLMTRYSTLGTLIPLDFQITDSTWFTGDYDLEGQTLLESINHVIEEINAGLIFYPQGDARLEINANFGSDAERDALPHLILSGNIIAADLFDYTLPLPYYKTIGQVEAGFASFQTSGADTIKLDGLAPASAWLEGNEKPVILAQLLPADLTPTEAITAAQARIGNLLEWLQPPELINITLHDGWRFLTCSYQVWVTFDLTAADNPRGLAITPDMRYLLQSLALTWSLDGTWSITGTCRLETQGGNSQIAVSIAPTVIDTDLPVLPGLDDYDSFPPSNTLNYQSLDPGDDLQPYGKGGLAQFKPLTTEDAGDIADGSPGLNCAVLKPSLNFKSNATRTTPNVTALNQPYIITVKGSARIGANEWIHTINFANGLEDFTIFPPFGTQVGGQGVTTGDGVVGIPPAGIRSVFVYQTIASTTLTSVTMTFDIVKGTYTALTPAALIFLNGGIATSVIPALLPDGTGRTLVWTGSAVVTDIELQIVASYDDVLPYAYDGSATLKSVTITGEGTNPFTGDPGGELFGDGFYQWAGENPAELYPPARGLLIDSVQPSVPPAYNENHEYTLLFNGTGNVISFLYLLSSYDDAQNLPLYVSVCGPGMGA
jgi:hypothetical protein